MDDEVKKSMEEEHRLLGKLINVLDARIKTFYAQRRELDKTLYPSGVGRKTNDDDEWEEGEDFRF